MDVEYSPEERERARTVLENDARTIRNQGSTIQERMVSQSECSSWRDQLRDTSKDADSLETEYSTGTVVKHVTGECHHDIQGVGVPLCRGEGGGWVGERVISAGTRPHNLEVYHTEVCAAFPEEVVVLSEGVGRQSWRECRECSGVVPEAKRVPRASTD